MIDLNVCNLELTGTGMTFDVTVTQKKNIFVILQFSFEFTCWYENGSPCIGVQVYVAYIHEIISISQIMTHCIVHSVLNSSLISHDQWLKSLTQIVIKYPLKIC